MTTLQRSKSAPLFAPPQPFLASHTGDATRIHRPRIARHHTSLALTDLPGPSAATRSGHQTPRGERTGDPFNLGGFFPSQLPGNEAQTEEWTWLRELETDEGIGPASQDHAWTEDGHLPTLDETEDEETGEMIRREDKLGVLSLRPAFLSREKQSASSYEDDIFSPYLENGPEDDDALCAAYRSLREAYNEQEERTEEGMRAGTLFSPVPQEADEEGAEGWLANMLFGLGVMLDMISV